MSLADRFRLWLAARSLAKAKRQVARCAAGRHHWKGIALDRVRCCEPGCGRWYGQ